MKVLNSNPLIKKVLIGVLGSLAGLILLLVVIMLLLPYLINLEPVKTRILAILFQQVGGKVEYQGLDLSYFPQPSVRFTQIRISLPEKAEGTLKSIQVYPKFLEIFRGTLRITTIQVDSPDFTIRLPEEREKLKEAKKTTPLDEVEEIVARTLGIVPGTEVIIRDGSLKILKGSTPLFSFSDLGGRVVFPSDQAKIGISCRSNLWEKMSIEAAFDPVERKGKGRIEVTNFRARALSNSLSLGLPFVLGDSQLNFSLRFETKGPSSLQASVEGSIPVLTFHKDNEDMILRGRRFRGAFQLEQERMRISIEELNLDYPQLRLSGRFQVDQKGPLAVLEIQGRDVDVASMREVALRLAGHLPITKKIFNIVEGGRIPLITFQSRAHSVSDLAETENFSVKGSLLDGKIFIPLEALGANRADRTLVKASGQVAISKGVLEGIDLAAQLKGQRLWEGRLRLGLEGENPGLHLETAAEMEFSVLPTLLNRLITDRIFLEEMARIRQIKGKAVGTLVLGESTETTEARIDIQEIQLLARHDRIPYPITIDSGKVIFDERRLEVRNLSGKVGTSSFSDLSARVDFKREPSLEVFSGGTVLSLEEIHSWLSSYESLREALRNLRSVKGRIVLSDMKLRGSLKDPEKWDVDTKGELKDLIVDTSLLPGPLAMTDGKFRLQPETIVFTDFKTRFLDASLLVSGTLYGYRRGLEKAELDFSGRVTPKDIRWLSDSLKVKKGIPIHSSIRMSGAHLSWRKGEYTLFRGDLTTGEDIEVLLDFSQTLAGLKVEKFALKDKASDCFMTLELRNRVARVSFSGELSARTLNRIFSGYQFQNGWLKGDFRASLRLDEPMRPTVQGRLEAADLSLPWPLEERLEIEHVSLTGDGKHISVAEARFAWKEMPLVLSGKVGFSEKGVVLDIALSADRLDVTQMTESLTKGKGAERARDLPNLQVEGTIRFKSNSLKYGRYTWEPFRADIVVGQNAVEVSIEEARLCRISMTGIVRVRGQEVSLDLQPTLRSHELESTARCLLDETIRATGTLELKGRIFAEAKPEDLFSALRGNLELQAKSGKIYYEVGLARILEFVNFTEVYRGKIPDMKTEGIPYELVTMIGSLQDGKLIIKEATLDGDNLQLAAQGEVSLTDGTVNLTVLVSPLRTVDRIINLIPLVRDVFSGTLLTIPVKVSGDFKDPKVTALSPSTIGSELLEMMKRTLGLPFKVINPLMPRKREESKVRFRGAEKRGGPG